MPRRIFPSLRRRRIRIDTKEMRLTTFKLTALSRNKEFAAEPEEQYV
jgi:hypothetical protein